MLGRAWPSGSPLATPTLHANCKRVCCLPVFNTMNNSDGVSILDLKVRFDGGVGAGVQKGTSAPKKVLICQKSGKISQNTGKIPQNLDTDVSIPLSLLYDE